MRVLGIDPGSLVSGYGALDVDGSGALAVAALGVLRLPRKAALPDRLLRLRDLLDDLLERLAPDEVAIEQPFVARNIRTAFVVGEARGVAVLAAAARHLAVHQYPPAQVRLTVAGYGAAGKAQVARVLALHLAMPPGSLLLDATDALAVALCHIMQQRARDKGFPGP